MLKKFAVTNYRGFENRIEWDLSRTGNYDFNEGAVKNGIIKNGIIYGPNGAGKSNFSLAIFDIENHLSQKEKKADYYANFAFAGNQNSPVIFEYTFQFGKDEVFYIYSKNKYGQLLDEQLKVNGDVVFIKQDDTLQLDRTQFHVDSSVEKSLRENVNHISIINFLVTSFPLPEGHCLLMVKDFADSMLWFRSLGVNEYIGLETGITNLEEFVIRHNLVDDFSDFLTEVSDQEFKFIAPNKDDKILMCNIEGSMVPFSQLRSTGTNSLMLLYYWYKTLDIDGAKFVFVDEFDAFYHFRLSFQVCKRLFEEKCQLFLSSHNTYLMTNDLLRPDCNFVLNHNKIKPLDQCTPKELRFGHNIERLYRGGAFKL